MEPESVKYLSFTAVGITALLVTGFLGYTYLSQGSTQGTLLRGDSNTASTYQQPAVTKDEVRTMVKKKEGYSQVKQLTSANQTTVEVIKVSEADIGELERFGPMYSQDELSKLSDRRIVILQSDVAEMKQSYLAFVYPDIATKEAVGYTYQYSLQGNLMNTITASEMKSKAKELMEGL